MATSIGHPRSGMRTDGEAARRARSTGWRLVVLRTGLIAGTLDIGEDLIFEAFHGITPAMVFRYIASGLIGARAAQEGLMPLALGVVLHYFIALTWTAVFYLASRKLTILIRRPIMSGLLYGILVYLCMNGIVLPIVDLRPAWSSPSLVSIINSVLAVVLCIGLTVSLLVRRSSART